VAKTVSRPWCILLNRPLGHTPEDQLLLHVQGVIAEDERAKFLERSRRGKRHAAQARRVGILCYARYGYRYVNKQEGGGSRAPRGPVRPGPAAEERCRCVSRVPRAQRYARGLRGAHVADGPTLAWA
jgi:hypothetical protein